jgi:hypothetical protein
VVSVSVSTPGDITDGRPNLSRVEPDVRKGLPAQAGRWREAARVLSYYEGRNAALILPREGEDPADFAGRQKLTSKITQKVVKELGKGLYAPGPTRTLQSSPAADAFYQEVAAANHLNGLMQAADRMAWLHGCFAIQVEVARDRPIRLWPWMASEFAVFLDDDDPTTPWAVCCRSKFEARNQLRYQLWDGLEVRTFWTRPGDTDPFLVRGDRVLDFDPSMSGPHGYGCLPFVFVHNERPLCEFWTAGVGTQLADTNAVLDVRLSDLDQTIGMFSNPRMFGQNVHTAVRYTSIPGAVMDLVPLDREKPADVFFRQPELMVQDVWMHIANYANQTLLDLDLPLTVLPDQMQPESGVAIVARRMPLIDLWRSRQEPFKGYESRLARAILTVAGSFYRRPELLGAAASAAEKLLVEFPEAQLPLPTPERDVQDDWEVAHGIKSLTQCVMERRGCTRAQAREVLAQVAEDRAEETKIITPADPGANEETGTDGTRITTGDVPGE